MVLLTISHTSTLNNDSLILLCISSTFTTVSQRYSPGRSRKLYLSTEYLYAHHTNISLKKTLLMICYIIQLTKVNASVLVV